MNIILNTQPTYENNLYIYNSIVLMAKQETSSLGISNCLVPSHLLTKILYSFLIVSIRVTYSAQLILLDLITFMTFAEE